MIHQYDTMQCASPAYKWRVSISVENTPLNLCHIFALQLQKVYLC